MVSRCVEYGRLAVAVNAVLTELTRLTTEHRAAFDLGNDAEFHRLDYELEQTMGQKERSIGALRQHIKEHKCQEG